jgi:hypothetical protein
MIRLKTAKAAAPIALPTALAHAIALALALGLGLAANPAAAIPMDTVVLQGLDKITARVSTIRIPVGSTVGFGALQITARACDKHPPEETPEAAAFLEVVEVKPDEKPVPRFSGWMFASSPALSALEHPVYDLVVLDCVNQSDNDAGGDATAPADSSQPVPGQDTKGGGTGAAGDSSNKASSAPSGSSQ